MLLWFNMILSMQEREGFDEWPLCWLVTTMHLFTEKAEAYKEDGNHNFKMSKYRWAIENYTVAIQCKCDDPLMNAVCYTNRAAAQFRLGTVTVDSQCSIISWCFCSHPTPRSILRLWSYVSLP